MSKAQDDIEIKVGQVKENEEESDPNLVTWTGANDPSNPHNWSLRRRLCLAAILSLLVALPPMSSTMLAPASSILRQEFSIESYTALELVFSIYNLGYGLGPVLLAPLSEIYGRLPLLHGCSIAFLVFNTGAGSARSKIQLGALRFLSAFVGSTMLSVGSGFLGDAFALHEFGTAAAVYGLMPLLGPVIGPIVGSFTAQYASWRWGSWALSLVGVVLQCFAFIFLHETYALTILEKKKRRLFKETKNECLYVSQDTAKATSRKAFLSLYLAFLTGVAYIIEYTFPLLWTERYNESIAISGLNYIAIGIGFILGALSCSYLNDRVYKALTAKNAGVGKPEFRIPVMVLGAVLAPIGLFWYGWAAQARAHWILADIGMAIYATGFVASIVNTHMYIVDYYGVYAASAVAAVSFAQSIFGFLLPLFGPALYLATGYGWGNSVMGCVAIVIGWPLPALLWRFGSALQRRSTYSARVQASEGP